MSAGGWKWSKGIAKHHFLGKERKKKPRALEVILTKSEKPPKYWLGGRAAEQRNDAERMGTKERG